MRSDRMRVRYRSYELTMVAFCLFATVGSGQQTGSSTPVGTSGRPTFRAGIELVALNVTVLDEPKRFVTDLGPEDFLVYEDGVRQELAFFEVAGVPVDLALVIDLSASMTPNMDLARTAAMGCLRTLRRGDRAMVIGFSDRVDVLHALTEHIGQLEAMLRQSQSGGRTALHNAIYIMLNELGRERRTYTAVRRQVAVVLTDGRDTSSLISSDDMLAAARRSGATIFTIALKPPPNPVDAIRGDRGMFEADFTLKQLSLHSGGRAFFPQRAAELTAIYETVAAEIAHQYVLGYVPDSRPADGKFRQVAVRVSSRGDTQVRTQRGYYATPADERGREPN